MGVSVGAFVALLIVLGYNIHEIGVAGRKLNPRKIVASSIIDSLQFLKTGGRAPNNKIYKIVGKYVAKACNGNCNATFGDLYKRTGRQLIIVGANARTGTPRYFNPWTDTAMPVRLAIKISSAIPLVCQYVAYDDSVYFDGAYASYNLLDYFDSHGLPNVIGLTISLPRVPIMSHGISLVAHALLTYTHRKHTDPRLIKLYTRGLNLDVADWPECMTGELYNTLFRDGFASVKKYIAYCHDDYISSCIADCQDVAISPGDISAEDTAAIDTAAEDTYMPSHTDDSHM